MQIPFYEIEWAPEKVIRIYPWLIIYSVIAHISIFINFISIYAGCVMFMAHSKLQALPEFEYFFFREHINNLPGRKFLRPIKLFWSPRIFLKKK